MSPRGHTSSPLGHPTSLSPTARWRLDFTFLGGNGVRVLNWHPACPPRPSSPPSLPQRPPRSWAPGAAAATSRLLLVRLPGSSGPSAPPPPDGEAPSILKCALAFPHHKNPSSASRPAPLSEVTARLPAEAAVTPPPGPPRSRAALPRARHADPGAGAATWAVPTGDFSGTWH